MRLTRETLIKIARDTATQRARVSRRIICIYLTGSCLTDDPLLGGTTDIDLVIVQDGEPIRFARRPAVADVDADVVTRRYLPAELAIERIVVLDARQYRHGAKLVSG